MQTAKFKHVLWLLLLILPTVVRADDASFMKRTFDSSIRHVADRKECLSYHKAATDTMTAGTGNVAEAYLKIASHMTERGDLASSMMIVNGVTSILRQHQPDLSQSVLMGKALKANGINYGMMGHTNAALKLLRQAVEIFNGRDESMLAKTYNNIFAIYYKKRSYQHANDLLTKSLQLSLRLKDTANIIRVYNNTGLISYEQNRYDDARRSMNRALSYCKASDLQNKSLIYTNIAETYYSQGNYPMAEKTLGEALDMQRGIPFTTSSFHTLLNMALTKARLGKRQEVSALTREIRSRAGMMPPGMEADYMRQMADIAFVVGDSVLGARYLLNYQSISDSILHRDEAEETRQLLIAYDAERLSMENEMLEERATVHSIFVACGILAAAILLVFVIILYRKVRAERRQNRLIKQQQERILAYEQQEHERQKMALQEDIDHKSREITSYSIDLTAINEFHKQIRERLLEIKNDRSGSAKPVDDLIFKLDHYNENRLQNDFKSYFENVHPKFIRRLKELYPQLTPGDERLCAYLLLGMSTKEIAALTFREVRSIDSSRNRLRKRLGVDADCNLTDFFRELSDRPLPQDVKQS